MAYTHVLPALHQQYFVGNKDCHFMHAPIAIRSLLIGGPILSFFRTFSQQSPTMMLGQTLYNGYTPLTMSLHRHSDIRFLANSTSHRNSKSLIFTLISSRLSAWLPQGRLQQIFQNMRLLRPREKGSILAHFFQWVGRCMVALLHLLKLLGICFIGYGRHKNPKLLY